MNTFLNIYNRHIERLFDKILIIQQQASIHNGIVKSEIANFEQNPDTLKYFGRTLLISDWSGNTDQGWKINQRTDVIRQITNSNYIEELSHYQNINALIFFCKAFEHLETFLKDVVYEAATNDPSLKEHVLKTFKNEGNRREYKGGELLFKVLKKCCGPEFNKTSQRNLENIKFKEFWDVISIVRNATIHSNHFLNPKKLKSKYHHNLFLRLFPKSNVNEFEISIVLTSDDLVTASKFLAEFGYQVYKIRSTVESQETNIIY